MAGLGKRRAQVPVEALRLAENVSKADLLEAAWHLAALCNGSGSDDDQRTLARLRGEFDVLRANQGRRPLKADR